jgi:protoporphyrinogen oxidase
MSDFDIIVVGAGVAGLAAADTLKSKGANVVVLEASDRAGGRVQRLERNGDMAEAGAQGYFSNYAEIMKLLRRYGLENDLVEKGGKVQYLTHKGERRTTNGNADLLKLIGVRGAADIARFHTQYVTLAKDFEQFEIERDIPEYDDVTPADELKWASKNFWDYVLRPLTHMMTTSSPEGTNLYYMVNCLKQTMHEKSYYLRGGNETLWERLAADLPIRLNTKVTELTTTNGAVDGVVLADGSFLKAKHVILACTAGGAGEIVPQQFTEVRAFLRSFPHTPYALPYFFLDRPLSTDAYAFFGHAHREATFNAALNHARYTPELAPSGKAIISAWSAFPESVEVDTWDDETIVARAKADIAPFFPGFEDWIEEVRVVRHRWGVARYETGMHRRIIDFKAAAAAIPGLSFAGTDYDNPHMEGGVRNGRRAAQRALA